MDTDADLVKLMGYLGEFGPYQKRQFLLHTLPAITSGIQMLALLTVAATPRHRCLVPGEARNATFPWTSENVTKWIPRRGPRLDSCRLYETVGSNVTMKCAKWVYDRTYFPSSRAIEWSMVCDRRWMAAVSQSAYMVGVLVGAILLGSLADRIGRKKVLCWSSVLQLLLGITVAFVPEFYTFLVFKFFLGMFTSAGAYNAGFVLTMELVGPSKRTACGISFAAFFTFGLFLVAFWGWLIPYNRFYLQVIYGCHSLLLIGHWWLVDESPRWLWSQGRRDEAVRIIRMGLKMNGKEAVFDESLVELSPMVQGTEAKRATVKVGLLSLFRTPNLRKRILNVSLNWFANSLAYYGLSLNTGSLPGNPFLMIFLTALVEFPSYISVSYLTDKIGRRATSSSFMVLGGLACLISTYIPVGSGTGRITMITVVMIGKFLVSGSFSLIFNYTAELFPTVLRTSALGLTSMGARASGALTPIISLLDSLHKKLPMVIFATIAIVSGLLTLLLPETLHRPIPQTVEDGEEFGENDTACQTGCCRRNKKSNRTADE